MTEKEIFFTLEVLYKQGPETKRWVIHNQTRRDLIRFRENIFRIGFMAPVAPGHGFIIPPWDITEITYERQSKFFE